MTKNTYGTGSFVLMNVGDDLPRAGRGPADHRRLAARRRRPRLRPRGRHLRHRRGRAVAAGRPRASSPRPPRPGRWPHPARTPRACSSSPPSPASAARGGTPRPGARSSASPGAPAGPTWPGPWSRPWRYQTRDVVDGHVRRLRLHASSCSGPTAAPRPWTCCSSSRPTSSRCPVARPVNQETTALGAAYLAGLAEGVWAASTTSPRPGTSTPSSSPRPTAEAADALHAQWLRAVERSRGWARATEPSTPVGQVPSGRGPAPDPPGRTTTRPAHGLRHRALRRARLPHDLGGRDRRGHRRGQGRLLLVLRLQGSPPPPDPARTPRPICARRQQAAIAEEADPLRRIELGIRASLAWSADNEDLIKLVQFAETEERFADALRRGEEIAVADAVAPPEGRHRRGPDPRRRSRGPGPRRARRHGTAGPDLHPRAPEPTTEVADAAVAFCRGGLRRPLSRFSASSVRAAAQLAHGLADAVLVLDQGEADVAVTAGAEARRRATPPRGPP